jgi:hypothetical protein
VGEEADVGVLDEVKGFLGGRVGGHYDYWAGAEGVGGERM